MKPYLANENINSTMNQLKHEKESILSAGKNRCEQVTIGLV